MMLMMLDLIIVLFVLQTIPLLLDGKDVVAMARTGKSAATFSSNY